MIVEFLFGFCLEELFLGSSSAPLVGSLWYSGRNQSKNLQPDRWTLWVESQTPEEEKQGNPSPGLVA